ncbi:hypothetical protein Catovirus_1_169 [Catovirus CTV1]|uniref:Uncharacterized protein n=1 Tax=Catovirus CTV1 TaxID=1977631 RepID=A0A1V0S8T7_9VIRU|nr:hypothetical protein Catovirus_1_169 [Catovirus CTV1]
MKFCCEHCEYDTDDHSSWNKHIRTKKHYSIVNKKNINDAVTLLQKEIEYLKDKNNILETQSQNTIKLLNQQIEYLKKELDEAKSQLNSQYKKQVDMLTEENTYKREIINQAGNIVQNSMSTLSFVIKNYPNAPPLEKISNYDSIFTNKQTFIKELAHHNRKKSVDEYLGKIIVGVYKKNDPKIQSLWSSDVSRQNYVIKDFKNNKIVKENNLSKWINDKNGVKLKKTIIKPFLEQVKSIGNQYIKENRFDNNDNDSENDSNDDSDDIQDRLETMMQIGDINNNINNKTLEKDICKLIAPYFQPHK